MQHLLIAAGMILWAVFCIQIWRRHRRLSKTIGVLVVRADETDDKLEDAQIRINEAHRILDRMIDTRAGEPRPLLQASEMLNVTYIHAPRHRRREEARPQ